MRSAVAVIGATGLLGREVTRQLLAAGERVVAVTRAADHAADLARLGAGVRVADLTDAHSLVLACRGVDRVIVTAHALLAKGRRDSQLVDDLGHCALIDAACGEGVRHFVYTSALGASAAHPVDFWRTKFRVERYLERSGVRCTILRPAAFMETHAHDLIGQPIIETGQTTILGTGTRPTNFVAVRDVARVAATVLLHGCVTSTVEIGGPENLTRNEVAAIYGRVVGCVPRVRHVPPLALRTMALAVGPFHAGLGRVMRASAFAERMDQTFDASALLRDYPMELTRVEDLARERTAAFGSRSVARLH